MVVDDTRPKAADHGKFLKGADRLYNELLQVHSCCAARRARARTRVGAMGQNHDVRPRSSTDGLGGETATCRALVRALVEGDATLQAGGARPV